ncbi:hypothetical protein AVEN_25634-1 [Araneus ventricosus]|uniref:Uncharacterized protein n=1 Tax=Araneus ventricosus TaxID=182803 RepID=A0A4Y2BPV3_ARAVE|nr:hypothetical protein AVEN_25634-1 [Araneus ventricosus]
MLLHSVETLLDYMGQRGLDYGDITAVSKRCVDIRQEMNKQQKQKRITDFSKAVNVKREIPSLMLYSIQMQVIFIFDTDVDVFFNEKELSDYPCFSIVHAIPPGD